MPRKTTTRALCFLGAGLLYGAAIMGGAIALGAVVKFNVALMLLAAGTAFLVGGILLTTK